MDFTGALSKSLNEDYRYFGLGENRRSSLVISLWLNRFALLVGISD